MAKKKTDDKEKKPLDEGKEEMPMMPGPDMPDNASSIDRLPLVIHSQYIRDLSFENPNAPLPLRKSDGQPGIGVDFAMDARKVEVPGIEEDAYEVVLAVSAHARKGEMTTFIVEVEYGMLVTLQDVPEDKIHPLLLIEMPNYMFPYVRQIISDLTQGAGYVPFMLSPVNFKALYRKRFGGPEVKVHERTHGPNVQKPEEEKETA